MIVNKTSFTSATRSRKIHYQQILNFEFKLSPAAKDSQKMARLMPSPKARL